MPLPQMPQTPPPEEAPATLPAQISVPAYKSSLVETGMPPMQALITHIEGMSWTVDIYSQVLRANENPTPYQPNQMPPYQQYVNIKGFELKLQGPLDPNPDTAAGTMEMTGTAKVYPVWHPHVGDVILADVGDGQTGVFIVTTARQLSLWNHTTYEIDFELSRILTQEVKNDLDRRTVKTTYFHEDFLTYGQNPLLVQSEVQLKTDIDKAYARLLREWLHSFFSNEYSTLVLPGQLAAIYDPYLVRAALQVIPVTENPYMRRVKELNVRGVRPMDDYCVLDALINVDESYLTPGHHAVGIINRRQFPNVPTLNGIYFSGVTHVVYPKDVEPHVDIDYGVTPPSATDSASPSSDAQLDLQSLIPDNVAGSASSGDGGHPIFHGILHDDGYIFTRAFYEEATTGQSTLELLVRQALKQEAIDTTKLFQVIEARNLFGRLEHFYFDFVLLMLLKIAQRQI